LLAGLFGPGPTLLKYVLILAGALVAFMLLYAGLMTAAGRLMGVRGPSPAKQAIERRDAALRAWAATAFPPVEWDMESQQYLTGEERLAADRPAPKAVLVPELPSRGPLPTEPLDEPSTVPASPFSHWRQRQFGFERR
jgi:hypothetical protein